MKLNLKTSWVRQDLLGLVFCSSQNPPSPSASLPPAPEGDLAQRRKLGITTTAPQDQGPVIPSSSAINFPVLGRVANSLIVNAQKRSAKQCPGFSQNLCDMTGAPRKCPRAQTWSSCERYWGMCSPLMAVSCQILESSCVPLFLRHSNSLNCSKSKRISAHKWVLQEECEQGKQIWCFPQNALLVLKHFHSEDFLSLI